MSAKTRAWTVSTTELQAGLQLANWVPASSRRLKADLFHLALIFMPIKAIGLKKLSSKKSMNNLEILVHGLFWRRES